MAHAFTIPKHRLDGLTDAVFGVAMTLLVLDLRLPEAAHFKNVSELLHGLSELRTQFLTYVISFFVLGVHWLGLTQISARTKDAGAAFARTLLIYLLFITCIPFSTMLVGRYGDVPLSSWIYAANMIGGSLASLHLVWLAATPDNTADTREDRIGLFTADRLRVALGRHQLREPRLGDVGLSSQRGAAARDEMVPAHVPVTPARWHAPAFAL